MTRIKVIAFVLAANILFASCSKVELVPKKNMIENREGGENGDKGHGQNSQGSGG